MLYFTYSRFVHYVYMYKVNFYPHHVQYDRTALHYAAINSQMKVVKYLLDDTGAKLNAKDCVSQC